ncbi:MAG: bifunctional chorismate mutase/prephenate dehydratase [Acidobacteria bacterium]|nr:bifunctional chorismate mutase/prephenate dehydratase [Acidobacteriota bacterium]
MIEKKENPRAAIDAIDEELLRLLNKRAAIALRVGEVKRSNDTSLCDPNREREVLARLSEKNTGPLSEQSVTDIFQRIIDECLHAQQRAFQLKPAEPDQANLKIQRLDGNKRVAFLGDHGTFSEEAAKNLLGESFETVSRATFEELFTAIDEGAADFILTPLENSLVGSIHRCYDLLLESSLNIAAEIILPISHCLIAAPGAEIENIEVVESHPAALAQCEKFFARHPSIKRVAADDTAGSVRRAIESGDLTKAAIGGKRAAKLYGGVILQEHLEDHAENYTRFALLTQNQEFSDTGNKISLVLRLAHRPGALHDALRPFVRRGIDLLKLESRPIKDRPWQYNFYLDLQAPQSESELRGALDEIRGQAEEVRYLGRYSTLEILNNK